MNQISPDSAIRTTGFTSSLVGFFGGMAPFILLAVVLLLVVHVLSKKRRATPELGTSLASVKPISAAQSTDAAPEQPEQESDENRQNGAIPYDGFDMSAYGRHQKRLPKR